MNEIFVTILRRRALLFCFPVCSMWLLLPTTIIVVSMWQIYILLFLYSYSFWVMGLSA